MNEIEVNIIKETREILEALRSEYYEIESVLALDEKHNQVALTEAQKRRLEVRSASICLEINFFKMFILEAFGIT